MMKLNVFIVTAMILAGCGGGGSSSGSTGGGSERGDISDRPYDASEAEYTIVVIEHMGEETFYQEVSAYKGFPMEFDLWGVQTEEYFWDNFELSDIEGCGGVRRMVEDQNNGWETIHNVPGDCTVTVQYKSTFKDLPHLVQINNQGYGATIQPKLVSVAHGEPAYFSIRMKDGYETSVSGCEGYREGGQFIIDSVNEDCSVTAITKPLMANNTVLITTSAMTGSRITPESAEVNIGDVVKLEVSSGFGFDVNVTGCNGALSEGVYEFTASTSCAVNVEAYPEQDVPIITIESSDGEPLNIEIQTLIGGTYGDIATEVPEVALLESINWISTSLAKPNKSIITSSSGCQMTDYGSNIVQGGSVSLSRGEDFDPMLRGGELDRVQTDCTWAITTEPTEFRQFGLSTLWGNQVNNEASDTFREDKVAFNGTATQFIIDVPGYKIDKLSEFEGCPAEQTGNVVTIYHGQQFYKSPYEVGFDELPELCPVQVDLLSNDYVDPWESYENQ